MSESYNTTSGNGYIVPKYSDGVDGPGAFKEFADGLDAAHIVPIKTDVSSNTNLIEGNASDIKTLANRLDALENTTLSAEWTIRIDGGVPNSGEVSLNSDVWASVTVVNFSLTDKNGVSHDFENVHEGDTIQIGVGPDAKLAGSSAAYTVKEAKPNGEFVVEHLSSTGSPKVGFTAIVAVYPQFDPSGYVTTAELDAVKADKLSKGEGLKAATAKILEDAIEENADNLTTEINDRQEADKNVLSDANSYTDSKFESIKPSEDKFDRGTGDLDYADAVVLGQAVTANKGDIADNAANITANKVDIDAIVIGIGGSVDGNGNITLPGGGSPIDISGKLDKGTGLVAQDAKELEDAIGVNSTNIETLVEALGGDINNIENIQIDALPPQTGADGKFLTTNGSEASWAEIVIPDALPDGGSEGQFLSVDADGDAIWAAPKTGDIALSADDANPFVVVDELGEFKNQSDVNTFIAEKAYFRGQTISWGDLANKPTG